MISKWPRYCEILLAVWLISSGWVLEQPDASGYRIFAVAGGFAVLLLDAVSIGGAGAFRYAHLLVLAVAAAQGWFAWFRLPAESQAAQNLVTVALLLAIFAILPTKATQPPPSWREFHRRS